jgi:hypothetical protein
MTEILARTEQTYANGQDRPLARYAGLLGAYGGTVGVAAAVAALAGRWLRLAYAKLMKSAE